MKGVLQLSGEMKLHRRIYYVVFLFLILIPLLTSIVAKIANPALDMMYIYLHPCFERGSFIADLNSQDATIYYLIEHDDVALFFQGPICMIAEIIVLILALRMKTRRVLPFVIAFSALMFLIISAWIGDYVVNEALPIHYNRIMLLGCHIRTLYHSYATWAYTIVFLAYTIFLVSDCIAK